MVFKEQLEVKYNPRTVWLDSKILYHKILVELSDLHNLRAIEKAYYASYGYPPEYALDLLDFNRDLNDTATRYINYLLIEE